MKRIKQLIIASFTILSLGLTLVPVTAGAVNVNVETLPQCTSGSSQADLCKSSSDTVNSFLKTLVNGLLFIIGIASIIMIIAGAIRLTTSGGNSAGVTAGKNMVLYAVIGLVIAFLAYAIVNWVLKNL